MSKALLLADSCLPPARSCALEDWQDAGGDGDDADGTRCVGVAGVEGVGVGVVVEEGVAEEAAEQAEGMMAAKTTELEKNSGRKVGGRIGEGQVAGEACAPWWSR